MSVGWWQSRLLLASGAVVLGTPVEAERTTIKLAQRVDDRDGRFLGIVVFSLGPEQLTSLRKLVDLGQHGLMAVVGGSDGVIRARFGANCPDDAAGVCSVMPSAQLQSGGSELEIRDNVVDRVRRSYSRRSVLGYDLVVGVDLGFDEVLAPAAAHARLIELLGAVVSLLLAGLSLVLAREVRRRSLHGIEGAAEWRRRMCIEADLHGCAISPT